MKNAKKLPGVALVSVIASMFAALAACTNPVADTLNSSAWGLAGSWTNPDYATFYSPTRCYLLTLNTDGTFRAQDSNGVMGVTTGTFKVDAVSISGNARQYKVMFTYGPLGTPSNAATLVRITDGTQYECVSNTMAPYTYPTLITNLDMSYSTFARQ